MKQYTEAERADIATECRRAIFEAKSKDASYRTLARGAIAEIALASLEAEPYIWRYINKYGWVDFSKEMPTVLNGYEDSRFPLYTSPPWPEVQGEMPISEENLKELVAVRFRTKEHKEAWKYVDLEDTVGLESYDCFEVEKLYK